MSLVHMSDDELRRQADKLASVATTHEAVVAEYNRRAWVRASLAAERQTTIMAIATVVMAFATVASVLVAVATLVVALNHPAP
ncbi:MAG: hypothetical protein ABSE70_01470 [Candidatus Limnocylindrales bacterium]